MAERMTPKKNDNAVPASKSTFLSWLRKVGPAARALEDAQNKLKATLKAAEKDGVNKKIMMRAYKARQQDPDEIAKEDAEFRRYMDFMGMPIGAQASLFGDDEPDTHLTDREQAEQDEWDAGESGFAAGKRGDSRDANQHPAGSNLFAAWDRSWVAGHERAAEEAGPDAEKVAAPKRGSGVPRKRAGGESIN